VSCDERERYFLCFPFFVTATHFQTMLNGFVFTLLLVVTSVELTLCYDSICLYIEFKSYLIKKS
jgi:hypothetical protein